jgi:uncharacterized repeat protein (TIGR03847 family)
MRVASKSFDFERVDRVTAGTIGPPGKRTFYLQLRQGAQIVSLGMEKQQLQVLADRLQELLTGTRGARVLSADMTLEEPLNEAWRIGSMTLAYDENDKVFDVSLAELVEEGQEAATGHFQATLAQMGALAEHASSVIAAGRPACPMCGGPQDHDGRICPRLNGHYA